MDFFRFWDFALEGFYDQRPHIRLICIECQFWGVMTPSKQAIIHPQLPEILNKLRISLIYSSMFGPKCPDFVLCTVVFSVPNVQTLLLCTIRQLEKRYLCMSNVSNWWEAKFNRSENMNPKGFYCIMYHRTRASVNVDASPAWTRGFRSGRAADGYCNRCKIGTS